MTVDGSTASGRVPVGWTKSGSFHAATAVATAWGLACWIDGAGRVIASVPWTVTRATRSLGVTSASSSTEAKRLTLVRSVSMPLPKMRRKEVSW